MSRSNRSSREPLQSSNNQSGTDPSSLHCADQFTIDLRSDWQNETVYRLEGPTKDGQQHVIQINVEPDVSAGTVADYARPRLNQQKEMRTEGSILEQALTQLDNGMPAYHAVLSSTGTDDERQYQEAMYVLHNEIGYRLSATYTRPTHPSVGNTIRRIFRSFEPQRPLQRRRP